MDKQQILDEIRRTAEENGGIPLGKLRFCKETGIKEADWSGKFWARWGGAVSEAGFPPNQRQEPFSEEVLIEKLIGLIRELDRFPVRAEMDMKARAGQGFPYGSTFMRHFRTVEQLVGAVQNYCRDRQDYEDVTEICEPIISKPLAAEERIRSDKIDGFVYLMKSGRYYKIGRSNAPGRREYDLSIQLPEKIETVHTIRTDDPVGIEAYWHRRFADQRKNGEWFELSASDIKAFRRRKFM